jgi:hypothetical protein
MEKTNKIIELIREMMVANPQGTSGAFSSKSPSKGPVAGFDKFLGKKEKYDYRKVPLTLRKWLKNLENK